MLGRITFWNPIKAFGFVTLNRKDGIIQQYFFHLNNFDGVPVLNALVFFNLGDPISVGKKVQAVGVRFATPDDLEQENHLSVASAATDVLSGKAGI